MLLDVIDTTESRRAAMAKKYQVTLTDDERSMLTTLITSGV